MDEVINQAEFDELRASYYSYFAERKQTVLERRLKVPIDFVLISTDKRVPQVGEYFLSEEGDDGFPGDPMYCAFGSYRAERYILAPVVISADLWRSMGLYQNSQRGMSQVRDV